LQTALEKAHELISGYERRERDDRARIDVEAIDGYSATDAQVQALTNLHAQKIRALMKTINIQQDKMKKLEKDGKEHKRSDYIQKLERSRRNHELVVDVCKKAMVDKVDMFSNDMEKVNQWLIKETVGGPLRFRPDTREELQNKLKETQRKLEKKVEMTKIKQVQAWAAASRPLADKAGGGAVAGGDGAVLASPGGGGSPQDLAADAQANQQLLDTIEELTTLVSAKDLNLRAQLNEMERVHAELRELRACDDKLRRVEHKYKLVKAQNSTLQDSHLEMAEQAARMELEVSSLNQELIYMRGTGDDEEAAQSKGMELLQELERAKGRADELEDELRMASHRRAEDALKLAEVREELADTRRQLTISNEKAAKLVGKEEMLQEQLEAHRQDHLQAVRREAELVGTKAGHSEKAGEQAARLEAQLRDMRLEAQQQAEKMSHQQLEINEMEVRGVGRCVHSRPRRPAGVSAFRLCFGTAGARMCRTRAPSWLRAACSPPTPASCC
jgi:hypothetical protein